MTQQQPRPDECGNCRFYRPLQPTGYHEHGVCRRYPPRADGSARSFPAPRDWCGEHKRRETAA